jgi:glutamate N-acetyltransferase/amino-acid N-acetyltransferase
MVAVLANGMAENKEIKSEDDPNFKEFEKYLEYIMIHLAQLIVSDGEGASKFIQYSVKGARDYETAKKLVKSISDSLLVKTAMFGRDPNWGRIVMAAGNAGVNLDTTKIDLSLGDENQLVEVLKNGSPVEFNRSHLKKLLRESHLRISMNVNDGDAEAVGWGSDITTDYVMFNSVYTT